MTSVVHWRRHGAIAHVTMEDRASRNTFSQPLVAGLNSCLREVGGDPAVRVVVLSGYENYFCCGGTQEELLRIFDGDAVFTDGGVFDLLLKCEVPVVAAMQGHALGGGLVMASYADVIVMASQCLYSANFMKYGFTPGFGATYIVPHRFGEVLGREMLFTAKAYYGADLKDRGVGAVVVDKGEVVSTAMKLAEELAAKPRLSLVTLKRHLNRNVRAQLPGCIEEELRMHELTIASAEVKQRIETLYGT